MYSGAHSSPSYFDLLAWVPISQSFILLLQSLNYVIHHILAIHFWCRKVVLCCVVVQLSFSSYSIVLLFPNIAHHGSAHSTGIASHNTEQIWHGTVLILQKLLIISKTPYLSDRMTLCVPVAQKMFLTHGHIITLRKYIKFIMSYHVVLLKNTPMINKKEGYLFC